MNRLPAVMDYMSNMCASYPTIGQSMQEFEEALQKNKTLKHSVNRLQLQLEDQNVDAKLVKKAAKSMDECRAETELAARIATACYSRILAIENHMSDAQIEDVLRLTVHLKQGEVMEEIKGVEKRCDTFNESSAILESRNIVQDFRQMRRTMKEAADELSRNEREVQAMLQQWSSKIKSSTAYRNKKIVYVLKLRKEIHEVREELIKPRIKPSEKCANASDPSAPARPSVMAEASNLILQSAMTFVSDFLKGTKEMEIEDREEAPPQPLQFKEPQIEYSKETPPLRSILVSKQGERKRAASPAKLVHFAPSPAGSVASDNENDNDDGALGTTFTKAIDESLKEFYDFDSPMPPKMAKITKVEILPPLDIRAFHHPQGIGNVGKSKTEIKDFSNLFPSFESQEQHEVMEIVNEAGASTNKQQPAVVSDELLFVRPSPPLSHQQDSNSMIITTNGTFQFSESNCDLNDDFMLNFSDDNNEDDTKNGYNL
ncbi:uncharacterized protein LOC111065341 [Drosophila obscura]|uniref:uncharacterized protein LOC111065341 n=1 Tax=Drosophila obscura TaxID=7282 RepID=UPI001BB1F119|nr:uncharacterized protein LOC111065341 [Drosophila obscura]